MEQAVERINNWLDKNHGKRLSSGVFDFGL